MIMAASFAASLWLRSKAAATCSSTASRRAMHSLAAGRPGDWATLSLSLCAILAAVRSAAENWQEECTFPLGFSVSLSLLSLCLFISLYILYNDDHGHDDDQQLHLPPLLSLAPITILYYIIHILCIHLLFSENLTLTKEANCYFNYNTQVLG